MFPSDRFELLGLGLLLLLISLVGVYWGVRIINKSAEIEKYADKQIQLNQELFKSMSIDWLGTVYANIFKSQNLKRMIPSAGIMMIIFCIVMLLVSLLAIIGAFL